MEVPKNVLQEILYRLPWEDLYDCKLVCKEWNFVISTPGFYHEKRRRLTGDHVLFTRYVSSNEENVSEVYNIRWGSNKAMTTHSVGMFCEGSRCGSMYVLGSYNGLVGISLDHFGYYCLWNPVTRNYIEFTGNLSSPPKPSSVGFCYDAFTDEYFIVIVGPDYHDKASQYESSYVRLINFTTNHSTSLPLSSDESDELVYCLDGVGTTVCGVPHWLKSGNKNVLYFDPNGKEFRELVLPKKLDGGMRILGLGALNGQRQLGIVLEDMDNSQSLSREVWVMKDYGKPELWTYMCKLPQFIPKVSNPIGRYHYDVNLLGLKPITGEVWMIVQCNLRLGVSEKWPFLVYDPMHKEVKNIGEVSSGSRYQVISYEPSFVTPKQTTGTHE